MGENLNQDLLDKIDNQDSEIKHGSSELIREANIVRDLLVKSECQQSEEARLARLRESYARLDQLLAKQVKSFE